MDEEQQRPSKRIKTDSTATTAAVASAGNTPALDTTAHESKSSDATYNHKSDSLPNPTSRKRRHGQKGNEALVKRSNGEFLRTFSQSSVLCTGDKGIFVTSDKGCEKKALLEIHDLFQEHLESRGVDAHGQPVSKPEETMSTLTTKESNTSPHHEASIEAEIASELAGLKHNPKGNTGETLPTNIKRMQLITLDIPCVSFVRLPPGSALDPVDLVHSVCLAAADPATQQRSRFVKRLTPVSNFAKALSQGIERISEDVLASHFGPDPEGSVSSAKFCIRPSVRENEQLNRNSIIKQVAESVQRLGRKAHKVDLKHYDKGILVEVYRGWVGMSVVDNTDSGGYAQGYEQLKRFNLAEVYTKR